MLIFPKIVNRLNMFKKIVVVGMGYVGIPVAVEFTNAGFEVE